MNRKGESDTSTIPVPTPHFERLRVLGLKYGLPPTSRVIVDLDSALQSLAKLQQSVN